MTPSRQDRPPAHPPRPTVTIIAESLGRDRGGAEIYLTRLVELLAQTGHPVQVYVRRPCNDPLADGVRVDIVPVMRRLRVVWELPFARQVARRLGPHSGIVLSTLPLPGITHYQPHSGLYRQAFEAMQQSMGASTGLRSYIMGNSLNWRRHSLVKMQEELLNGASPPKVMTFSRTFRAQLLDSYPGLASSAVTVPLGVDLERFRPGPKETHRWFPDRKPGQMALLFAGHNFRLKGLRNLLLAFREALRQDLHAQLLVVGHIRGNRTFPAMVRLLGLSSHVRFQGPLPDAEMASLYRSCDALIHPTFSDHCSLVVLEALACGLPVVTTRQNGAAELMEDGEQGFILDDPKDIAALTDALLRLQDPETLARMSAAAIALRPRIDFDHHARQVLGWLTGDPESAS